MTNEEIIEGNKLLAEFMGGKIVQGEQWEIARFYDTDGEIETAERVLRLKYRTSWEWLMPVVEKIEEVSGCPYRVVIASDLTYITDKSKRGTPEILRKANNGRKENTWLAVVEFINWYNNQNKKSWEKH